LYALELLAAEYADCASGKRGAFENASLTTFKWEMKLTNDYAKTRCFHAVKGRYVVYVYMRLEL